jgi:hypothetical protein
MSTDASQADPFQIQETPLEGFIDRSYLQSVGYLMTATAIVIVVDPILQERATAYLWTIGAAPIWHTILTKGGYLEEVRDLSLTSATKLNYPNSLLVRLNSSITVKMTTKRST